MATDQVRGATADAILRGRALERGDDAGMSRKAEVVVTAEVQVLSAVQLHHRPLGRLQGQALAIQVILPAPGKARLQAIS